MMKFGLKKWASLVLGKVYENFPKIKEKYDMRKLTGKRVILIGNPYFFFSYKCSDKIMKFGPKKIDVFGYGKSVRKLPKN